MTLLPTILSLILGLAIAHSDAESPVAQSLPGTPVEIEGFKGEAIQGQLVETKKGVSLSAKDFTFPIAGARQANIISFEYGGDVYVVRAIDVKGPKTEVADPPCLAAMEGPSAAIAAAQMGSSKRKC